MRIMAIRLSIWLWRGVIALVFLGAAWVKWSDGVQYDDPLSLYDRIVAGSPVRHFGILAAEVFAAAWMLSGTKLRWSAVYTATMLVVFCIALGFEIRRADPEVCGCGLRIVTPGGDPRIDLALAIVRNIILMFGCAWLWLLGEEPEQPTTAPTASAS